MYFHLLDAGFDIGLGDVILVLLVIPLGIIFLEAIIMKWLKFNSSFGKCFLDSFLANLATVVIGYLMTTFITSKISVGSGNVPGILVAFILSFIVEGLLLFVLNQKKPQKMIWQTSFIMNLASYLALILLYFLASL